MRPYKQRRQYLVERDVQLAVLKDQARNWALFMVVGFGLLFAWECLVSGLTLPFSEVASQIWARYAPAIVVLALLLPKLLYDSVRQTNRFAGPVFRLRRELRRLGQGERVAPLKFRDGDFWQDMAGEFNRVVERLRQESPAETPSARTPERSNGGRLDAHDAKPLGEAPDLRGAPAA